MDMASTSEAVCPEIKFPPIPINGGDPVEEIAASPLLAHAVRFFDQVPPWSEGLLCAEGLALMYYTVRALRPQTVVEIGTCKGWTAHVLAAALEANDHGEIHTVGPYDSWRFLPLFEQWPEPLRKRTTFYSLNSAHFFQDSFDRGRRFDMILVDGNHDYEFALFDIQCSARALEAGGIIFVDNVEQSDVRCALDDFLAKNPAWVESTSASRSDVLNGRNIAIIRRRR